MSNNDEMSAVVERIQKLLALSESANEHEAGLAAAKAAELLMKYNLTMDKVELSPEEVEVGYETMLYVNTKKAQRWEQRLAYDVARFHFCEVLVSPHHIYFVGREANREVAMYVFTQLAERLHKLARKETRAYIKRQKGFWNEARALHPELPEFDHRIHLKGANHHKAWRAAWLDGAVSGIRDQLETQRTAKATEGSKALVVVRGQEVSEFVEQQFPNTRKKAARQTRNWDAFVQGVDQGKNMQIQPGLSVGSKQDQLKG